MKALTLSFARKAVVATVIAILILTVLEFPPPIGFETRPQSDVPSFWLVFFLTILIVEIAAIPMVYKRQSIGSGLGIFAAILNILQVIADQAHLMQPEVAPLGYSLLEGMVVIASLALAYFSWYARKPEGAQGKTQNEMRNQ
jgi:cytochrome bd-type quinol oxidase subunit 2